MLRRVGIFTVDNIILAMRNRVRYGDSKQEQNSITRFNLALNFGGSYSSPYIVILTILLSRLTQTQYI